MVQPKSSRLRGLRLPPQLTALVILICLLPLSLNVLGVDSQFFFGSQGVPLRVETIPFLSPYQFTESLHLALSGSFTHTILEWVQLWRGCTALFTAILAFAHFATTRDVT